MKKLPVGSFFQWRIEAPTDMYIAGVPVSKLPGKPQGCRYPQRPAEIRKHTVLSGSFPLMLHKKSR